MRRLLAASVAIPMFLFAGRAGAQDGPAIKLTAQLKADRSTGKELSFVYILGDAIYPDGTSLTLDIQDPTGLRCLKATSANVSHGQFIAEIGPWDQRFPAGRYHIVARFQFENQSPAIQQVLAKSRDMDRCIATDPEYRKQYYEDNPAWAAIFEERLRRTGRCPGKSASGGTDLQVGSDTDAEQARASEDARLRGEADLAASLCATVAFLSGPPAFATWRADLAAADASSRTQHQDAVCWAHPEARALLESALLELSACADDVESLSLGRGAEAMAEIREREGKDDTAGKDERRALARAKAQVAALESSRDSHLRTIAAALASASYGLKGLEPAPERERVFEFELLEKAGVHTERK